MIGCSADLLLKWTIKHVLNTVSSSFLFLNIIVFSSFVKALVLYAKNFVKCSITNLIMIYNDDTDDYKDV